MTIPIAKVVKIHYTPLTFIEQLKRSIKLGELAKKDNKSVGDFSGVKSSIKDENETISEGYMK